MPNVIRTFKLNGFEVKEYFNHFSVPELGNYFLHTFEDCMDFVRKVDESGNPRAKFFQTFSGGRTDRLRGMPCRSSHGAYIDGWYSVPNPGKEITK